MNIIGSVSLSLMRLAETLFPNPTAAEKQLLQAVPGGKIAYCGVREDDDNPASWYAAANNPTNVGTWDADRNIRAELIRWLCTNHTATAAIDPHGICICGARITGKLDLSYVTIAFPLCFDRCVLDEDASFDHCKSPSLDLTGSHAKQVSANGANVAGDLTFDDGFVSEGGVSMLTAQIGGNLECSGGTFRNRTGPDGTDHALYADRAKIAGSIFLGKFEGLPNHEVAFRAQGTVRLVGAQIGGSLECSSGSFSRPSPVLHEPAFALLCDRMKVGNVFLRDGFSAHGEVRLWGGDIGTNLICTNGNFSNPLPNPPPDLAHTAGKNAFSAHGAKIAGDVLLDGTFDGAVELPDIQAGGSVNCVGGSFTKLIMTGASMKGSFRWSEVRNRRQVVLDLTDATAGPLQDSQASWPERGNLKIDGFTYSRISSAETIGVEARLRWLKLAQFSLQPFQQLAKVLKESGDVDSPPDVLLGMEQERREHQDRGWMQRTGSWILHWTIGYGQKPLWALRWVLALIMLGSVIFGLGYLGGAIVPNDKDAYASFKKQGYTDSNYTGFNALIYSMENSFPVITLGVKAQWQPSSGSAAIRPALNQVWLQCLRNNGILVNSPGFLRAWLWMQTIAGWVLATLFVAGLTGIVKTG